MKKIPYTRTREREHRISKSRSYRLQSGGEKPFNTIKKLLYRENEAQPQAQPQMRYFKFRLRKKHSATQKSPPARYFKANLQPELTSNLKLEVHPPTASYFWVSILTSCWGPIFALFHQRILTIKNQQPVHCVPYFINKKRSRNFCIWILLVEVRRVLVWINAKCFSTKLHRPHQGAVSVF